MYLSDTEEMLIIVGGAVVIMAIVGATVKDYRRMRWEAKKEIEKKEKEEAYIKKLTALIEEKNKLLQAQLKAQEKKKGSWPFSKADYEI